MLRQNCGVFDETTRLCIACGQNQEGTQCEVEQLWTRREFLYCAAKLMFGGDAYFDADRITTTRHSDWNPLHHAPQTLELLTHLVLREGVHLRTDTGGSGRFVMTIPGRESLSYQPYYDDTRQQRSPDTVTFDMRVSTPTIARSAVAMACKLQLARRALMWPTALCTLLPAIP